MTTSDPIAVLVALPTPLHRLFEYLPAADDPPPAPGSRVLVPFGKQQLVGVVVGHGPLSYDADKTRRLIDVLDPEPLFDSGLLGLYRWCAEYYRHPLGETLHAALPVSLRRADRQQRTQRVWRLSSLGMGLGPENLHRSPRQQQLVDCLLQSGELADAELVALGMSRAALKSLQDKGLVEYSERREATAMGQLPSTGNPAPGSGRASAILAESPLVLGDEQREALQRIRHHRFGVYLLQGITGSGKTEVYLHAIARALQDGRQALVLIPEIGLAPQTLQRFRDRFRVPLAVLHSNVATRQRELAWHQARTGEARVVIGTRLAALTPMPQLGIIIVDEEHDLSFKQQDGIRYSARDFSLMRARALQIPVILGSATPSLESLHNAGSGRFERLRLTARAGAARPAELLMQDTRGLALEDGLSPASLAALEQTLSAGGQAMVFLNRRGYAPALICAYCGWSAQCRSCSGRLTLHKSPAHLRCHHCDRQRPVPQSCPSCGSHNLSAVGQGTVRTEETLRRHFPLIDLYRVDQDSMQRKDAMQQLTERLSDPRP